MGTDLRANIASQKPPPEPLLSVCNLRTPFPCQNCAISFSARAPQVHAVPLCTRWNWVHTAQQSMPRSASKFLQKAIQTCIQNGMKRTHFSHLLSEPHLVVFCMLNMLFLRSKTSLENANFYLNPATSALGPQMPSGNPPGVPRRAPSRGLPKASRDPSQEKSRSLPRVPRSFQKSFKKPPKTP